MQSHNLRTGSDCEVISHLYEEHGDNFVSLLDGMFACALYDKENERLLAFRDHVGICSLYIGWGEKGEV